MMKRLVSASLILPALLVFTANASTADFTATFVCEGSNTLLQSTSTASSGTIVQWLWDFNNDNNFSDASGANVNYVFPGAGSYLVGLRIITDQSEIVQTYKTVVINPVAVASFSSTQVCEGGTTTLTSASTISSGSIANFAWDFNNDGNYDDATGISAQNIYPEAGTYIAALQVTSDSGCVSVVQANVIVHPNPTPSFTYANQCLGDNTQFTGSGTVATGSIVSYQWELNGDGQFNDATGTNISNQFINAGNYQIGLRVTTDKGCSADTFGLLVIAPIPYINFSFVGACADSAVAFTNLSFSGVGTMTYSWNFGDNTAPSTLVNPTHAYDNAGNYTITLTGTSSYNCTNSASQNITINGTPIAEFTAINVCHGETTVFTNTSKPSGSIIQNFHWNFGDGTESAEINPTHDYLFPGTYNVTLTVYSTEGCLSAYTIPVNVWTNPVANIVASGPTEFCDGGSVTLSVNPGTANVLWSVGTNQNSITVSTSGDYNVLLYDAQGCKDRDTVTVTVYQLPVVVAESDTVISAGFTVPLWASGAQFYDWQPAEYLNVTSGSQVSSTPLQTITYTVTGTDIHGCVNSDVVTVTVNYDYTLVTYNLFSPNNDGVNDFFEIMNLQLYPDCEVVVYNRLGSPVFSASGYQNNWDGTYKGEPLPDATYYYVVKCAGTDKIYKGPISILR